MEHAVNQRPADRHPRSSRVQSVDRAVVLLQAVAAASGRDATVASLALACQLNRATAWRILSTLEDHGMVVHDRRTGQWSVGSAVAEIARAGETEDLVLVARPVLARLSTRTGETADLAVLRGVDLTYVAEVRPAAIVSAEWLGATVPLHATSTGKALLAFVGDDERGRLLPNELTAHTATTLTDRDALAVELTATRRRGYATCHGELESHLHGVSAPVLDWSGRVRGVVSIWGPDVRVTADRLPALGALAVEAAAEIAGDAHLAVPAPSGGPTQMGEDQAISPSTR